MCKRREYPVDDGVYVIDCFGIAACLFKLCGLCFACGLIVSAASFAQDPEIRQKVEERIRFSALLKPASISVYVEDGVVYLNGNVANEDLRGLAEETAESVDGVVSVHNNISVRGDVSPEDYRIPSQSIADANITLAVNSKLLWDRRTSALKVDVDTENGVVQLSGRVDTEAQKLLTEKVVREVGSVVGVVNSLEVADVETRKKEKEGGAAVEADYSVIYVIGIIALILVAIGLAFSPYFTARAAEREKEKEKKIPERYRR